MDSPLVSIIIPVYNVEEYLEECIESVLNQTYGNIEIITINDGSTDRSLNILNSFSWNYKNIKLLSQENSGQSVARNYGLKNSKGKYIYFLDSDDYILPNTILNLVRKMELYNLDIVRFGAKSFTDKLEMKVDNSEYDFKMFFEEDVIYNNDVFLEVCLKAFSPSPVLYMTKRELIVDNNITFFPKIIHEDELFSLEIFLNAKSMMYDPSFYYRRRFRKNSTMTTESKDQVKKSFDSYYVVLEEVSKLITKYKSREQVKLIKQRSYKLLGRLIYNNKINKRYKKEKLNQLNNISLIQKKVFELKNLLKRILK